MSERTDHPPSTEASTRANIVRRAVVGGVAGVALLVGPVALANAIVPANDDSDRVEAAAQSLAAARQAEARATEVLQQETSAADDARLNAYQSLRTTTTTVPPTTTTTEPPTTTTEAPTTTAPPTTEAPDLSGDLSVWDALAECESGGNWHINTGNGFYGGLQFSASSWAAVGGTGLPHEHSREVQIQMGQRLQAQQGWGAWPSCSAKLGLT